MPNTPPPARVPDILLQDEAAVKAKAAEYKRRQREHPRADVSADTAKEEVANQLLTGRRIDDVKRYFRELLFRGFRGEAAANAINAVAYHNRGRTGEVDLYRDLHLVRVNPAAREIIALKLRAYRARAQDQATVAQIMAAEAFLAEPEFDWGRVTQGEEQDPHPAVNVQQLYLQMLASGIDPKIASNAINVMINYNDGQRPDLAPKTADGSASAKPGPPAGLHRIVRAPDPEQTMRDEDERPAPRRDILVIPHPNAGALPDVIEEDPERVPQGTWVVNADPARQAFLRGQLAAYRAQTPNMIGRGPNDRLRQALIASILATEAFISFEGSPRVERVDAGELVKRIVRQGVPAWIAREAVMLAVEQNNGNNDVRPPF